MRINQMRIISKKLKNLITQSHIFTTKKSAFTLAEILLTIAIVGVISVITMGILKNSIPTKEESIHKKMNSVVEQIVSRLIDNEVMYPETADKTKSGFQNTNKVTVDGIDYEGDTKFCQLFAAQFTTATDVNCVADERTFSTADNVDWYLPVTDFSDGYAMIMIDVNGKDEGNNCLEGTCKNPDRFVYYVRANGTITNKKPNAGEETTYKVNLTVVNPEGGKYAIGEYNEGVVTYGEAFEGASHTFEGLKNVSTYVLKAIPSGDYTNKWEEGEKTPKTSLDYPIVILGSDKDITLTFLPKETYCITLQVRNCAETNLSSCINIPTLANSSAGTNYSMDKIGIPQWDEASLSYVADTSTPYAYFVCGLSSGTYNLSVTTKAPYQTISGGTSYSKTINLGTENQTDELEIRQTNPCSGDLVLNSSGECVCPEGTTSFYADKCVSVCTGHKVWSSATSSCVCEEGYQNVPWGNTGCYKCSNPDDFLLEWRSGIYCISKPFIPESWQAAVNTCGGRDSQHMASYLMFRDMRSGYLYNSYSGSSNWPKDTYVEGAIPYRSTSSLAQFLGLTPPFAIWSGQSDTTYGEADKLGLFMDEKYDDFLILSNLPEIRGGGYKVTVSNIYAICIHEIVVDSGNGIFPN